MESAVLFLVYNRPDTTRQVFEAIRTARPPRLYVAADGPRDNRPGEVERCKEVRRIATAVDWPCEVKTLFRDQNIGCKRGVAGGINWFFEHEEEGIILEDDVRPLPSFFPYCEELLERYRHDERVAMISGCNLISSHFQSEESYFFSRYNHIWGWASWRRAWKYYDVSMTAWPAWRDAGGLARLSDGSRQFECYWRHTFNKAHRGDIDTWDYQWTFACWRTNGITVLPKYNLTSNLGFGPNATHTTAGTPHYVAASIPRELPFPIYHPNDVSKNTEADALIDNKVFDVSRSMFLKEKVRSIPVVGALARLATYVVRKISG